MTPQLKTPAVRQPYAVAGKDQSGGRLLLAIMGLSVVVPLLLVSCYMLATREASADVIPSTFGLVVLVVWLTRRAFRAFKGRIPEENESIMNFSPLGVLTCICDESDPGDAVAVRHERRQTCRTCGHAIIARDPARVDAVLTSREISNIQAKLRYAAVKSKGMDLPTSIEDVDQLVDYLQTAPAAPPSDPPSLAPATRRFA